MPPKKRNSQKTSSKNQKNKGKALNASSRANPSTFKNQYQMEPDDLKTRMQQDIRKGHNSMRKMETDNLGLMSDSDLSNASDVDNPKKGSYQDQINRANKLLMKNKVNALNGFNFEVYNISEIQKNSGQIDYEKIDVWKRNSLVIFTGSRIYAFKVDGTHIQAINVFGNAIRQGNNQQLFDEEDNEDQNNGNNEQSSKKIVFKSHLDNQSFNRYIQKLVRNINMDNQQLLKGIDPIMIQTKRKFDQGGLKTLLMNSLGVSKTSLQILINPQMKKFSIQQFKQTQVKPRVTQQMKKLVQLQMTYPGPKSNLPKSLLNLTKQREQNIQQNNQNRTQLNNNQNDRYGMMEIEYDFPIQTTNTDEFAILFSKMKQTIQWKQSFQNYDYLWDKINNEEFNDLQIEDMKKDFKIQDQIINNIQNMESNNQVENSKQIQIQNQNDIMVNQDQNLNKQKQNQFDEEQSKSNQQNNVQQKINALIGSMLNNPIQQQQNQIDQQFNNHQINDPIQINQASNIDDNAQFIQKQEKISIQERRKMLLQGGFKQSNQKNIQKYISLTPHQFNQKKRKTKEQKFFQYDLNNQNINQDNIQMHSLDISVKENTIPNFKIYNGQIIPTKTPGKKIIRGQKKLEGCLIQFDYRMTVPRRDQIFSRKSSKKNQYDRPVNPQQIQKCQDKYIQKVYPSFRQAFVVIPTTLFHWQPPAKILKTQKNSLIDSIQNLNIQNKTKQNQIKLRNQKNQIIIQDNNQLQQIYKDQLYKPQQQNIEINQQQPAFFFANQDPNNNKRDQHGMRQNKQKMVKYVINSESSTFSEIYRQYTQKQNVISPALAFLTCLHIANEHIMKITSFQDETDLFITDDKDKMKEYIEMNQNMGNRELIQKEQMQIEEAVITQQNIIQYQNLNGNHKKNKRKPQVVQID